MPAHLAERTVRSALPFALGGQAAATLASASVVALSRGVLRAMLITKLKMGAIGLLAALGMTVGAGVLAEAGHGDEAETWSREFETGVPPTSRGKVQGRRRPANAVAIVSDVETDTKIIALTPNGSKVRRGDVVCRLDSEGLEDRLAKRAVATARAEAAYQKARRNREVAEIAVTEYRRGDLQAGTADGRRRDQPGRGRARTRRGAAGMVRTNARQGLRLQGSERRQQDLAGPEGSSPTNRR